MSYKLLLMNFGHRFLEWRDLLSSLLLLQLVLITFSVNILPLPLCVIWALSAVSIVPQWPLPVTSITDHTTLLLQTTGLVCLFFVYCSTEVHYIPYHLLKQPLTPLPWPLVNRPSAWFLLLIWGLAPVGHGCPFFSTSCQY